MKTIALLLVLAVPSGAVAQSADAPLLPVLTPKLSPAFADVEPPLPLYREWYFWVAVSVGVAAIAAACVGAFLPKTTAVTTPQQLCGPNGCDACIGFACR